MENYNNNFLLAYAKRSSVRCTTDIITSLHVLKQSRLYLYIFLRSKNILTHTLAKQALVRFYITCNGYVCAHELYIYICKSQRKCASATDFIIMQVGNKLIERNLPCPPVRLCHPAEDQQYCVAKEIVHTYMLICS